MRVWELENSFGIENLRLVEKPRIGATVRNALPSFSLPLIVAGWSAPIVALATLPLSTLCTNEL